MLVQRFHATTLITGTTVAARQLSAALSDVSGFMESMYQP